MLSHRLRRNLCIFRHQNPSLIFIPTIVHISQHAALALYAIAISRVTASKKCYMSGRLFLSVNHHYHILQSQQIQLFDIADIFNFAVFLNLLHCTNQYKRSIFPFINPPPPVFGVVGRLRWNIYSGNIVHRFAHAAQTMALRFFVVANFFKLAFQSFAQAARFHFLKILRRKLII